MDRNTIAIAILAFSNSLFVFKYAGRHGLSFLAIIYFLVFLMTVKTSMILNVKLTKYPNRKYFVLFIVLTVFLVILSVYVLPENSRVGRLPAMSEWLQSFLHGVFPYGSPTKPSGFPVLFLLAIPFHFLGNYGLLEAAGIGLFGITILKNREGDIRTTWTQFLILLLLPTVYYEIVTRSELFFNMSLALALLALADFSLTVNRDNSRFAWMAVAFGLVLSTRLIVAPVYMIFVLYKFRESHKEAVVFSLIAISTFALTLIPFLIWNPAAFLLQGPFRVQFAHLPGWGVFVTFVMSLIFGYLSKNMKAVASYSGMAIFAAVALGFAWSVCKLGFIQVIFNDRFDIGYFILCVPFLLYGLDFHASENLHLTLADGTA